MVDTKLTALSAIGTLGDDDYFYVVDDPAGTPLSRRVAASVVKTYTAPAASDTVAGVVEIAIQSEQETGTDVVRAVTPGRQHFHPSAAKAWVRFNNAGTVAASYNITSITDSGEGDWSVNIATDFSSASYCGVMTSSAVSTSLDFYGIDAASAAGVYNIGFFNYDLIATIARKDPDINEVHASFFGDQA